MSHPKQLHRVHKRSPFHRVVVYHQTHKPRNGDYYVSPTPLIPLATHVIIAAFHLNDDHSKGAYLNDHALDDPYSTQVWIDVARMQGSGIKVLGMLGGAGGNSFRNLTRDFDNYYRSLNSCIVSRKLDGIDIDVENPDGAQLALIVKLIKQLRSDFGQDFIITLAPVASALSGGTNISGFSYRELEAACGDDIDWYNAQFYSGFGSMANTTD